MKINLEDKITRFVVQEYVGAIVGFGSLAELDFMTHKLIHTFEVARIAEKLVALTTPKLPVKLQKKIIDAAILHDVGRCYEFKKKSKKFDHGLKGSELIQKKFPNLIQEQLSTLWHNKAPSDSDPIQAQPLLDYTRDADILGNLDYNIRQMPIFLKHIVQQFPQTKTELKINDEIISAARAHRPCCYRNMEKFDFLDMMLAQLAWIYNLRTTAGFKLAKKEKLFPRYRDVVVAKVVPALSGSQKQKQQTAKQILSLFPDDMFLKEFEKHGI